MNAPLLNPSTSSSTPSVAKLISIAGLILLGSGCAGDSAVSPTAASETVSVATASMTATASTTGLTACVPNARLIGRIAVSTADTPGTWWHLTREGMDAAGLTDYLATMEGWFGREFSSEAEAISFLGAQVAPLDVNGNGYVCAYTLRGTRTSIGDPDYALTLFGARDDKHAAE